MACLGVFCVKIRPGPLAVASCKNQKKNKKLTRFWCAKSRMRGDETPGWIVTNFCTGVGVHDVITRCRFVLRSLTGFGRGGGGGQILAFSIDDLLRRPYNTPCECVMSLLKLCGALALHCVRPVLKSMGKSKIGPPVRSSLYQMYQPTHQRPVYQSLYGCMMSVALRF